MDARIAAIATLGQAALQAIDVFQGYNPARQGWDKLIRLTDHPLPDVNPRLAVDATGRMAVAWQGWRGPHSNIFVRSFQDGAWAPAVQVSSHPANEWEPAVALDSAGTAWVAYDSYANGNYDVFLAAVKGSQVIVPEMAIADTPLYEVKPTVAVVIKGYLVDVFFNKSLDVIFVA